MSSKNKWLSKDGKYYDDYLEKKSADYAWETQRKEQQQQNALLAEQNRLLQEENDRKEKLEQERLAFEREKEQNRYEEMLEQQQHDKEMRILGLFDSIGLNKQYYDNFIKYLASNNEKDLEDIIYDRDSIKDKIEEIDDILTDPVNNMNEKLTSWHKGTREEYSQYMKECYNTDKKAEKLRLKYEKFINTPWDLTEKDVQCFKLEKNRETYIKRQKDYQNYEKMSKILLFTCIISFILVLLFAVLDSIYNTDIYESNDIFMNLALFLMIPAFGVPIIAGIRAKNDTKNVYITQMKGIIQKEINNIPVKVLDEKKAITKCNKIKNELEEQLKTMDKEIKIKIQPKWEDFIDFRKKHYNSQFESLLLDLELKEQIEDLGLTYPKINNSNKTSDGTIDDYIAYFDNLM